MKDLTISMPKWYEENSDEYDKILKNTLLRENFKILFYSNVVKKVAVEAYDGGGWNQCYGIYDFEKDVFYQIGGGTPSYRISGVNWWNKEQCCGSFAWFELFNSNMEICPNGERCEMYKLVIDSRMNNAPNLSGKDVFDSSFRTPCDIVNNFLYFEHKGVRYLIDGDYKILAKFPKRLDNYKSVYVDDDTRQFILKNGSKWCLYDIDEKKVVFDDIVEISGKTECDFRLDNGDIYTYDKKSGRFVLLSKYDTFCDGLYIVKTYRYAYKQDDVNTNSIRDLIYVLKDDKGKFYIRHNNKIVNKKCPFDKVELKKGNFESENRFVCTVSDISDIYDGYDKFRFNTLNIDGVQEKLWFDKDLV